MAKLFPSLISADLLNLQKEIDLLDPYVDGYHLDVMDFHFVPNLTWGPDFINAIRKATKKPLFVHLMVDYPERYLPRFSLNQGDTISIHRECRTHEEINDLLNQISALGYEASIALNPGTNIEALNSIEHHFQNVLIMSVEPGFSGQEFLGSTWQKLDELVAFRVKHNLSFTISIDGGINKSNARDIIARGADQLAVASAIFNNPDRLVAIKNIL